MTKEDPFANMTIGSDDCEFGRHNKCKNCSCTCHPLHPKAVSGTPLSRLGAAMDDDWVA